MDSQTVNIIRTFAYDYYNGQWSRLYRLGCRADSLLRARGHHARTPEYQDHISEKARQTPLYRQLEASYADDRR